AWFGWNQVRSTATLPGTAFQPALLRDPLVEVRGFLRLLMCLVIPAKYPGSPGQIKEVDIPGSAVADGEGVVAPLRGKLGTKEAVERDDGGRVCQERNPGVAVLRVEWVVEHHVAVTSRQGNPQLALHALQFLGCHGDLGSASNPPRQN